MRIIFVPQYPAKMRYQEWWFWKLPEEFKKCGYEVITLGQKYIDNNKSTSHDSEMFSSIHKSIEFETEQIKEYMQLNIKKDDILFVPELSFPGLFCNVLYHKRCSKMFAFCHATSLNKFDYFENIRKSKFMNESSHALLFNKIFIGSHYHKKKLLNGSESKLYWNKAIDIKLPFLPFIPIHPTEIKPKKHNIISVARPSIQKINYIIENQITELFGEIYRPKSNTWEEYFNNLSESKILLISAREDTFGYQIVDAVMNGCIPLAPNNLSYPEILPKEYLYNDINDLIKKIKLVLNNKIKPVKHLICEEEMINFYKRIISEMEN